MVRIALVALFGAVVGGIVTGGNTVGVWVGLFVALAAAVLPLLNGRSALRCPACRKRVKLGAAACHHCGRQVGRAATG